MRTRKHLPDLLSLTLLVCGSLLAGSAGGDVPSRTGARAGTVDPPNGTDDTRTLRPALPQCIGTTDRWVIRLGKGDLVDVLRVVAGSTEINVTVGGAAIVMIASAECRLAATRVRRFEAAVARIVPDENGLTHRRRLL